MMRCGNRIPLNHGLAETYCCQLLGHEGKCDPEMAPRVLKPKDSHVTDARPEQIREPKQ